MARRPKKTPPTTVRFSPVLNAWVREVAASHPDGQSGVINDAVEYYRNAVERRGTELFRTIAGSNGHDGEDTSYAHPTPTQDH